MVHFSNEPLPRNGLKSHYIRFQSYLHSTSLDNESKKRPKKNYFLKIHSASSCNVELWLSDQCDGEPGGGQGLRERELLREHQVPVLRHREHPRDARQSGEAAGRVRAQDALHGRLHRRRALERLAAPHPLHSRDLADGCPQPPAGRQRPRPLL